MGKHKITINGNTIETDDDVLAHKFLDEEKNRVVPYHPPVVIQENETQRAFRGNPIIHTDPNHYVPNTGDPPWA